MQRRPNRVFTSNGNLTLDKFTDRIKELMADAMDHVTFMMNEPTGNDTEGFPKLPVITYDVGSRLRSESHKSLEPIKFNQYRDPNDPGFLIEEYRMWYDVELVFKVYDETNKGASLLMQDFEDFLFTYKPHFKEIGLSEILFLAETPPEVVTRWNKELPQRSLRYLVRIERITIIRSNILQNVNTVVEDADPSNEDREAVTYRRNSAFMKNYSDLHRRL